MKLSFHQHIALFWMIGAPGVTFRRRQHEISKVDRTVFSDVGVASENGIYGHSRFCNTDFDDKLACLNLSGV
ncbi:MULTISPECIES: integrase [Enterobacteriaceae]|jgi:hypothetical protein|uniref:Putative integrase n=14 Tax=Gammaproteobacteria TaxID=1236 RepID=A0A0H3CWB7_ENTCC|nr:integrase [Enterobacter hormaechei]ADF64925.1 putative integrase [Enterobacter cloacae subsp. cloacae ATCC 13047]AKZ87005.1 hypothetical protein LI65_025975 [Enterobacter hormaechei subsp. steigerwaltii]AOP88056.1 hypothetical protein BFV64_17605 [Enterobacter kobei]APR43337.1 hypothetical protein AM329_15300 [Enterobacter cloacae complex sp. AR_0002]ASA05794.1 integrase [Enterobacter cloacae complex sp.]EUM09136.1 hypothetical protein L464_04928 [Enterobacter sp. BIDMC 28]EUM83593.1 hypo